MTDSKTPLSETVAPSSEIRGRGRNIGKSLLIIAGAAGAIFLGTKGYNKIQTSREEKASFQETIKAHEQGNLKAAQLVRYLDAIKNNSSSSNSSGDFITGTIVAAYVFKYEAQWDRKDAAIVKDKIAALPAIHEGFSTALTTLINDRLKQMQIGGVGFPQLETPRHDMEQMAISTGLPTSIAALRSLDSYPDKRKVEYAVDDISILAIPPVEAEKVKEKREAEPQKLNAAPAANDHFGSLALGGPILPLPNPSTVIGNNSGSLALGGSYVAPVHAPIGAQLSSLSLRSSPTSFSAVVGADGEAVYVPQSTQEVSVTLRYDPLKTFMFVYGEAEQQRLKRLAAVTNAGQQKSNAASPQCNPASNTGQIRIDGRIR
jgi:hypothetical protein